MEEPEDFVRRSLHVAAEVAPAYDASRLGVAASSAEPARRARASVRTLAAVAAATVVAASGATWWILGHDGSPSSEAVCAAVLTFQGRTYMGYGPPDRVPRSAQNVGRGIAPGCSESSALPKNRSVAVHRLRGVDLGSAVFAGGSIWVNATVNKLPARVGRLNQMVACHATHPSRISGQLTAIHGPPLVGDKATPPTASLLRPIKALPSPWTDTRN